MGSWYLLGVLFQISDEHPPILFKWEFQPPPPPPPPPYFGEGVIKKKSIYIFCRLVEVFNFF